MSPGCAPIAQVRTIRSSAVARFRSCGIYFQLVCVDPVSRVVARADEIGEPFAAGERTGEKIDDFGAAYDGGMIEAKVALQPHELSWIVERVEHFSIP